MMNALPDGLVKWHRFVREQDMQALAAALADDVVFRSPVLIRCGGIYIVAKNVSEMHRQHSSGNNFILL
jgi:ketosteroid isomerase-like protein